MPVSYEPYLNRNYEFMKPTATIRLLTTSTNEKGDLFTRLMDDLLHALGYENLEHDIHTPGHEIDIQGRHRYEPRMVMAECKAHTAKMGGAEINKFRGALEVEKRKKNTNITGYFISLGGIRGSAWEQEKEMGEGRLMLFDAPMIITELENSKMLLTDTEAAERAGQCAQYAGLMGAEIDEIELLANEEGYIKAVIYSQNKERTHVALIHAGGVPLALGPAQLLLKADKEKGGTLHTLQYLVPKPLAPDRQEIGSKALESYRRWLGEECGFIHLDGLPTDQDLSPKRLKLERLFVPLKAMLYSPEDETEGLLDMAHEAERQAAEEKIQRPANLTKARGAKPDKLIDMLHLQRTNPVPIGELLTDAAHIALLAAPGGGKSTLLKRLATAYAFADRRLEISDGLPEHDWLPLFLRCRELRNKAEQPILSILEDIPTQTSMPRHQAEAFQELIQEKLQAGRVLLLVDGLDEIADERSRKSFANNLRTFLAIYPQVALVVTSREAGFRIVAGVIADICQHAHLAPLEEEDIRYLCEQWHVEVASDTSQVREQAQKLVDDICSIPNIYALAQNPLLLTTLLIVKRNIGELPRNRAVLYAAAVKLLVKTWNIEGFGSMNEQESLAQLAFVACAMQEQGIKQIAQTQLLTLLEQAREVLAAELQYTKVSPVDFLDQIEHRSSLLMLIGQEIVAGELVPIYEFRHLTFQEFLAARGYAKDHHSQRNEDIPLVQLLAPHFKNENWWEVIPLAAVLAERKADAVIKQLIIACQEIVPTRASPAVSSEPYLYLLFQCILDEVTINPETLTAALKQIGRCFSKMDITEELVDLLDSRVGEQFQRIIEQEFVSSQQKWDEYADVLGNLAMYELTGAIESVGSETHHLIDTVIEGLHSKSQLERVKSALCFVNLNFNWQLAFEIEGRNPSAPRAELSIDQIRKVRSALDAMLVSDHEPSQLSASWALVWGGAGLGLLSPIPATATTLGVLLQIWHSAKSAETARYAAWALREQPLLARNAMHELDLNATDYTGFLENEIQSFYEPETDGDTSRAKAALLMGWYLQAPWDDATLASMINSVYQPRELPGYPSLRSRQDLEHSATLLQGLGTAGKRELEARKKRMDEAVKRPQEL